MRKTAMLRLHCGFSLIDFNLNPCFISFGNMNFHRVGGEAAAGIEVAEVFLIVGGYFAVGFKSEDAAVSLYLQGVTVDKNFIFATCNNGENKIGFLHRFSG